MVKHVELLDPGAPVMLDRYQLVGELASGGMATVYLGRLPGLAGFQRMVAVKRLHPHLAKEQEFIDMFVDEARLAASIHHQNVVPILEIGESKEGYYLVMEYVEGVTLARLVSQAAIARAPVPRPVLLRVVLDTLAGLHAAHEQVDENGEPMGVVHRDCSPQNILVGVDGCSRITDFGVARAATRLSTTREGAMKGKLCYMAPEQTQGDSLDRRADVFSVGVVLWECLTSRRLLKADSEAQTLRRLLVGPIPRASQVEPSLHPELDLVCSRALEREPAARYDTAAEMAEALEHAARRWGADEEIAEPIASGRTVAALMQERYGATIAEQRDAVRRWLQDNPSPGVPSSRGTLRGWSPALAAEPPPSAARSDPPAARAASERGTASAAADEEDDTRIYDSNATGVSATRDMAPLDDQAIADRGRLPAPGLRRGGTGRAIAVAMVVGVLVGATLLATRRRADSAPTGVAAAPSASTGEATRVGGPSANTPSPRRVPGNASQAAAPSFARLPAGTGRSDPAPTARATGSRPTGAVAAGATVAPVASAPAAASPSTPRPAAPLASARPVVPHPPDDDLSNPYR